VSLDSEVRNKVTKSLALAEETAAPDRVFLNLENIQGRQNASVLAVYVDVPAGDKPSDHPELLAGTVGLFGLRAASAPGGRHGGQGLSFTPEITKIVDALHLTDQLNRDTIAVTIVPSRPPSENVPITIGRISLYRKGLKVTYTDRERPLDRNVLLCISGVGWIALLLWPGASAHCLAMVAGSMPLAQSLHMLESMNSPASLVTGWFLMLAAMMAPVLILPIHHVRVQSFRRRRLHSITHFILGYMGIWLIGGVVLLGMALAAESFVWPI
jgi:Predicted metal-binding integral membrane protein (DUF2182)